MNSPPCYSQKTNAVHEILPIPIPILTHETVKEVNTFHLLVVLVDDIWLINNNVVSQVSVEAANLPHRIHVGSA